MQLFRASPGSLGDLVKRARVRVTLTAERIADLGVKYVPSLISRADHRKATGLDGVTISTWKAGRGEAARGYKMRIFFEFLTLKDAFLSPFSHFSLLFHFFPQHPQSSYFSPSSHSPPP